MGNVVHETIPVQVWADVDVGIADVVRRLNDIPGVRTHASCQGTIGEVGAEPYPPRIMVSWQTSKAFTAMAAEFEISDVHEAHCIVHSFRNKPDED